MILVLGIETSCDETGGALYNSESKRTENRIYSQDIHGKYGGVIPELAARDHLRKLPIMILETLKDNGLFIRDIDLISYTKEPGLIGAVLVGSTIARSISYVSKIESIGVNHVEAHLFSPMICNDRLDFPFIGLVISGGHTILFYVENINKYRILGETLDDAVGEVFDKTARLFDIPYPGGAKLAEISQYGKHIYKFPIPMIDRSGYEMSFSGIKTHTAMFIREQKEKGLLDYEMKCNIAYSLQYSIFESIARKCESAMKEFRVYNVAISGGVSANRYVKERLSNISNCKLFAPDTELCTDNALMIAYYGFISQKQLKKIQID